MTTRRPSPILRAGPLAQALTRRGLLASSLAAGALLGLPRSARAAGGVSARDRRYVFIYTMGGWDPTRVFTPELLDSAGVETEAQATWETARGLDYIDHVDRPAVRSFLEAYGDQVLFVNGLYISSISHFSGTRLSLTGSVEPTVADWPARIAASHNTEHYVPHLLVRGPGFSGPYGVDVGRAGTNNQFRGLADGSILDLSETPVDPLDPEAGSLVDAYVLQRAAELREAAATETEAQLMGSFHTALDRAVDVREISEDFELSAEATFKSQLDLALEALAINFSRTVMVAHPDGNPHVWDTHKNNDSEQSRLFQDLFEGLAYAWDRMAATPGVVGETQLDEVCFVVLSEMARTPFFNQNTGKDHWPYSSAMLLGAGVRGGQSIGGWDQAQYGADIDLQTGKPSENGYPFGTNVLGATLMAHAGVDWEAEQIPAEPILDVIE
jgi:uncharacterized protein (DUF1501 family)